MKTCLFLISFDSLFKQGGFTLFDAVDAAAKFGYDAVEPYPVLEFEQPDTVFAKKFREYCDAKGLAIPCFSMGIRLETKDWREAVQRLKGYAEVASVLGSKLIHHTLVPTLGRDEESFPQLDDITPQLVTACTEVAQAAEKMGVSCVYEDQGYVVNGVSAFSEFYKKLPFQNKGVVVDFGNIQFVDESIDEFASRFALAAKHVHMKDYLKKAGGVPPGAGWYQSITGNWLRGTIIGHGVTNFVPVIQVLLQSGYNGYWSVEFDGPEPALLAARQGLENIRYYYQEAKRQIASFSTNEVV